MSAGSESGWRRALLTVAGVATALLAFYVSLYPLRRFRLALGSDTPVYVWWARRTAALGVRSLLAGGRPGTVTPLVTLSSLLHVRVGTVIAALLPVFGAALALAVAALVDVSVGHERRRFVLVAFVAGVFLSLLVSGYLSTLAFGATFVAALACFASGEPRAAWVAGGALVAAAGLAHPLFLALGGAVAAGACVALLLQAPRGTDRSAMRRHALRITAASLGGAIVAFAILRYVGPGARVATDTSRDAALRAIGLGSESRLSYVRVLERFFPWYRAVAVVGAAALAVPFVRAAAKRREARRPAAERAAVVGAGAMAAWLVVTVGGIVLLVAGTSAPGQRLAAFCLPLPALAGVGLDHLVERRDSRRGRPDRRRTAITAAAVLAYGAIAWSFWGHQQPLISQPTSLQFRAAGAALAAEPAGTPLILVADDRGQRPGFSAPRNLNYLRDSVPSDRIQDVYLFMGSPAELLAGRLSRTGQTEHDRLAARYFRQVEPLLRRTPPPLAVVIENTDAESYAAAFHLPAVAKRSSAFHIAPGVLTLPAAHGTAPVFFAAAQASAFPHDSGTARMSPWTPVLLAPVLLALLWLAGIGWVRASLPFASRTTSAALAPAFAIAAVAFASIAVDALGVRLGGAGGTVAFAAAAAGGLSAWAVRARVGARGRFSGRAAGAPRGARERPPPDPARR